MNLPARRADMALTLGGREGNPIRPGSARQRRMAEWVYGTLDICVAAREGCKMWKSLPWLFGVACASPALDRSKATGIDTANSSDESGTSAPDAVWQAHADDGPVETIHGESAGPGPCPDIYAPDLFPTFSLEMSDEEVAAIERDYARGQKNWHPAQFQYADEVYSVQVRLKGNPNFSWNSRKMQYVISFNEDDPDARFQGLRKLSLDASWYEPTLLRERLSWTLMREVEGLPASCANNAQLMLNGVLVGTYANIEYLDHEYLERVFGRANATGTLWKYGTEPKANAEEADYDEMAAFWRASSVESMMNIGNVDEWIQMWAAEAVLGDDDGFLCCEHNFYTYRHPTQGILLIPWDFDDVMDVAPFVSDPITGYEHGAYDLFSQRHVQIVLADPARRSQFVAAVDDLNQRMAPERVLPWVEEWTAQIDAAVAADPLRSFGDVEREQTLERLAQWLVGRHAFLSSWVACEQGREVDADGDGLLSCADIDDSWPVQAEVCNGRDDDHNGKVDDSPECDDCAQHDLDDSHFLLCRWPRSYEEAESNCNDRGGTLAYPSGQGEQLLLFFHTWPEPIRWWLQGQSGTQCVVWDEGSFSTSWANCAEEFPSVCRISVAE